MKKNRILCTNLALLLSFTFNCTFHTLATTHGSDDDNNSSLSMTTSSSSCDSLSSSHENNENQSNDTTSTSSPSSTNTSNDTTSSKGQSSTNENDDSPQLIGEEEEAFYSSDRVYSDERFRHISRGIPFIESFQFFNTNFPILRAVSDEEQSFQILKRPSYNYKRRSTLASPKVRPQLIMDRNDIQSMKKIKPSRSLIPRKGMNQRLLVLPDDFSDPGPGETVTTSTPAFYPDPGDLIPSSIVKKSETNIKHRIRSKDIKLSVNAPSAVETTPGQFTINVLIENKREKEIKDLNVGIRFHDDEELSLIPPVPEMKNITLEHSKSFSFNVNVGRIDGNDKITSFCIYLYSKSRYENGSEIEYRISSYTHQVRLSQSPPKKAIIVVPGICGSELFSGAAQVIKGHQYSEGYRIWPPEGAMDIVDGGCQCMICNAVDADASRLLSDLSLVGCKKNGNSKFNIMLSNPILNCRTNPDNRNFGTINVYKDLVQKLVSSNELNDYEIVFFSYDWRQSNKVTANALKNCINDQKYSEVVLVGHSMGGLLCASLMTDIEEPQKISKIILLGAPVYGAAKAYSAMEKGTFFDGFIGAVSAPVTNPLIKSLAQTCPSVYELLPPKQSYITMDDGFLYEKNGCCSFTKKGAYEVDDYLDTCSFIKNRTWATEYTSTFLENAQEFHDSLYDEDGRFILSTTNVPVFNLTGFNSKSLKGFYADLKKDGKKCSLDNIKCNGDGTVTLDSSTARFSFAQGNTYYAKNVSHMGLMSDENCLELINNIISNRPNVFNPRAIQKFTPREEVVSNGCCA